MDASRVAEASRGDHDPRAGSLGARSLTSVLDPYGTGANVNLGGPELGIIVFVVLVGVLPVVLILALVSRSQGQVRAPSGIIYTAAPPTGGGRWYADPTGRFAQRWWDGGAWTQQVVLEGGQQTIDPTSLPDPPPAPPAN